MVGSDRGAELSVTKDWTVVTIPICSGRMLQCIQQLLALQAAQPGPCNPLVSPIGVEWGSGGSWPQPTAVMGGLSEDAVYDAWSMWKPMKSPREASKSWDA